MARPAPIIRMSLTMQTAVLSTRCSLLVAVIKFGGVNENYLRLCDSLVIEIYV